jgi:hypothetical protein
MSRDASGYDRKRGENDEQDRDSTCRIVVDGGYRASRTHLEDKGSLNRKTIGPNDNVPMFRNGTAMNENNEAAGASSQLSGWGADHAS